MESTHGTMVLLLKVGFGFCPSEMLLSWHSAWGCCRMEITLARTGIHSMGYVVNPGEFKEGAEHAMSPRAHTGPPFHANMASPSKHPNVASPTTAGADLWPGAGLLPFQNGPSIAYGHGGMMGGPGPGENGQRSMGVGYHGGPTLHDPIQAQQLDIAQQLVELQGSGGGSPQQVSHSCASCPASRDSRARCCKAAALGRLNPAV